VGHHLSGHTLVLTLDKTIQYLIEQELREAVGRYGAEGGSILVLEPKTGALLASASYPTYDPRHFAQTEEALFVDPAIGRAYEPGSTFKVITMAAALETGVIRPQDVYNDLGYIEVGGRTFKNWDEKAYGPVTMADVFAYSLNTGVAHASVLLEPARFYHYVDRFGLGHKTGIDLEGEVPGVEKCLAWCAIAAIPSGTSLIWEPMLLGKGLRLRRCRWLRRWERLRIVAT
jgi:cell division protein FtsI/penicillin-binding protein 2